eukprot:3787913-Pyramimonas_sp.AAC.1
MISQITGLRRGAAPRRAVGPRSRLAAGQERDANGGVDDGDDDDDDTAAAAAAGDDLVMVWLVVAMMME